MSSDQPPPPGSGPGQGGDPFRKRPPDGPTQEPGQGAGPPPESPYGSPPPGWPHGGSSPAQGGGPGYGYGYGYGAPGPAGPPLSEMPPLAGSGRRLLARIVDALVIAVPVNLLLALVGVIDWSADASDSVYYDAGLAGSTLSAVAYFLYEGIMLSARGQTLGKMLLGIRVALLHSGAVPSGGPAWLRAFVYSASAYVCCLWPVNVLWHLFDQPYRQCLHDKAARTVVVTTR